MGAMGAMGGMGAMGAMGGGMGYGMAPRPAAPVLSGQQLMKGGTPSPPLPPGASGGGGAGAYKATAASLVPKSSLDALDVWGK
jgi:hypothetical protein